MKEIQQNQYFSFSCHLIFNNSYFLCCCFVLLIESSCNHCCICGWLKITCSLKCIHFLLLCVRRYKKWLSLCFLALIAIKRCHFPSAATLWSNIAITIQTCSWSRYSNMFMNLANCEEYWLLMSLKGIAVPLVESVCTNISCLNVCIFNVVRHALSVDSAVWSLQSWFFSRIYILFKKQNIDCSICLFIWIYTIIIGESTCWRDSIRRH